MPFVSHRTFHPQCRALCTPLHQQIPFALDQAAPTAPCPALRGISESKGFHLPVRKLQKIHLLQCGTLSPILKPNPLLTTCLLQKLSDSKHHNENLSFSFELLPGKFLIPLQPKTQLESIPATQEQQEKWSTIQLKCCFMLAPYGGSQKSLSHLTGSCWVSFSFLNSFFYQLLVIPASTQQCKSEQRWFYRGLVSGHSDLCLELFLSNKVNLDHIFSNHSTSHAHRKKKIKKVKEFREKKP